MRHKNLNFSFFASGPLVGTIVFFTLIGLIASGCAMTPIAPQQDQSNAGAESAQNNRNDSGGDAASSGESAPTSSDRVALTATPPPRPTRGMGAAAPAADEEAAFDSDMAAEASSDTSALESGDSSGAYGIGGGGGRVEPPKRSERYEPVTAGVVDDNEQWESYLEYRSRRAYRTQVNERDVSERYLILVQDEKNLPVHDAEVTVYVGDTEVFVGRTDTGGRVLFHPKALDAMNGWRRSHTIEFQVAAQKEWVAQRQTFDRYDSNVWILTLADPPAPEYTQVDLLFLMDATGSMDDEIAKLKASMADIADQIYDLPEQPDVRFGLVHYRDRGDAYVVRTHDFTHDLSDFQETLAALQASGGGDNPESLNEALHVALNNLNWRTQERDGETLRLILLVADAPPHLDYHWQDYAYDTDMIDAATQGIKIFPVGASGLAEQGEYIFRQMAQFTGGKFVFLTYDEAGEPSSGPGTETSHDVENYSVNTLDKLVVRLVKEELSKLTQPIQMPEVASQRSAYPGPRVTPTPRPARQVQPASCTLDLDEGWNDCGGIAAIDFVDMYRASRRSSNGQALVKLTLDPRRSGYSRVEFEVIYSEAPNGWTVNIGDSPSNNGYGGDGGDQSNDAEMIILDGALVVYGNDYTPERATTDGHREMHYTEDMVRGGESMTIEVANEWLSVHSPGGNEEISSPYLYALARQPDREGRTNYELYAAFNRTIASEGRKGSGVSQVILTVYPRR
ncbi:MAG: vWA domain-containing protein [Chloroflexota bacterium]